MHCKVGIICASDEELAPFIPMLEPYTVFEKAMLNFYNGTIECVPVTALFSGVCKTNAAIAAQLLIDSAGCNVLINSGTAGGMDAAIKLFDTVISTEAAYWDVAEDVLTEFHPWMESVYFKADDQLIALAKRAVSDAPNVHFGRMITGEAFIDEQFRDSINERYSPLCVDMETAAIAHVCHVNRVPYIAVRTVTDTAKHSGVDVFDENCGKASAISADIVRMLLKEIKNTVWK